MKKTYFINKIDLSLKIKIKKNNNPKLRYL